MLSILAVLPALLLSMPASGQILHRHHRASRVEEKKPQAPTELAHKYTVFVGYGYKSLNQVNQSRHGLQGTEISGTRDFSKYFGLQLDGAYYRAALGSNGSNPGDPSVTTILAGPVFHAPLSSKLDGFVRVLIGGEHTGGESMKPDVSFAGGYGVGVDWNFSKRISFRASGDDIISAFVQDPDNLGYSPHKRSNSRAAFGFVYKF